MPNERLGAQGYDKLRNHPFFKGFDWSRPRRTRAPKLHKVQNKCSDSAVMFLLIYSSFFLLKMMISRMWMVIVALHRPTWFLLETWSDNAGFFLQWTLEFQMCIRRYLPLMWEYWNSVHVFSDSIQLSWCYPFVCFVAGFQYWRSWWSIRREMANRACWCLGFFWVWLIDKWVFLAWWSHM